MEIQIKAYAYTIDIITEIRYFCKCNNAVFGKFRIIFTYTISKTNCSLHHNFHALFKISGNGKFVRTAVLPPRPSRNLSKSTPRPRTALNLPPLSKVRCCRPKEFGRLPEGLPHHYPLAPHQPSRTRTIPCFAPTPLPPLSKGGGLTARHKLSLCCIFTCDTSTFLIYQTFRRQDGGIAISPFAQHHIYASLVKGEVLSPERIRATTGGIATPLSPRLRKPF